MGELLGTAGRRSRRADLLPVDVRLRSAPRPHLRASWASKRAACTSARARRSCCRCPAQSQHAHLSAAGLRSAASPGSRRRRCSTASTRRRRAWRAFAGVAARGADAGACERSPRAVAAARGRTRRPAGLPLRRRNWRPGCARFARCARQLRSARAVGDGRRGSRSTSGSRRRRTQFQQALRPRRGIRLEALADRRPRDPGAAVESLIASRAIRRPEPITVERAVTLAGVEPDAPPCARTGRNPAARSSCEGPSRPPTRRFSTPYWKPRTDAARYDFEPGVPFGVPFRRRRSARRSTLTIAGADVTVDRPIEFRYDHIVAGEKRMELQVVPAVCRDDVARDRRVPAAAGHGSGASVAGHGHQSSATRRRQRPTSRCRCLPAGAASRARAGEVRARGRAG